MTAKQPLTIGQTEQAVAIIRAILPRNPNYQRNRDASKQVEWYGYLNAGMYQQMSDQLLKAGIPHTLDVTDYTNSMVGEQYFGGTRSSRLRSAIGEFHDKLSIHSLSIHIPHGTSVRNGNVQQTWVAA